MESPVLERLDTLRADLAESARGSCEGKSPAGIAGRAALAAYLAYTGVRYLGDPFHTSLFDGITLVFHEMGHLFFRPFGHTMYVLGGSLAQLFVPASVAVYLVIRQEDWFGSAVGLAWLAFSGWNLALYVADANKEQLPLASMSPGIPKHDWATLLTEWRCLNSCDVIATWIRVVATLVWGASMILSAWLLWSMIRQRATNAR